MSAVEDRMWWYAGLHRMMIDAYVRHARGARTLVDAGCGTGGFLRRLKSVAAGAELYGVDAHQTACTIAEAKSGIPVLRGSVERLPFERGSVDVMFSADVLCHADVEPNDALAEARRCLRPGGILILNLPAYEWMRSAHDDRVRNGRRFTRRDTAELLHRARFGIRTLTYWNVLLFPLMAARRLLLRRSAAESDVRPYPTIVEAIARSVLVVERRMLNAGITAPFGGSVLAVAVSDV